jgi:ribosomal protein L40E
MNADTNEKSDATQEIEEQELCAQCMTDNRPGTHFCRKCGAPLSSYAATGPFESLFAEGHVYRRATEQPQRLIVLLGIWLIFGSVALAGTMIAATSWGFGLPFGVGLLSLSLFLIAKTSKNYRKRPMTASEDNG